LCGRDRRVAAGAKPEPCNAPLSRQNRRVHLSCARCLSELLDEDRGVHVRLRAPGQRLEGDRGGGRVVHQGQHIAGRQGENHLAIVLLGAGARSVGGAGRRSAVHEQRELARFHTRHGELDRIGARGGDDGASVTRRVGDAEQRTVRIEGDCRFDRDYFRALIENVAVCG